MSGTAEQIVTISVNTDKMHASRILRPKKKRRKKAQINLISKMELRTANTEAREGGKVLVEEQEENISINARWLFFILTFA